MMVDTERFQLGPELIHRVTTVSARIALDQEGRVNPLQPATYLPIDVESVCRVLESVEEDYDIDRVERDGITYFEFAAPEERTSSELDIEAGEHLDDLEALENSLAALKSEEGWSRKVEEQHKLLRTAAAAGGRDMELSYFLDECDVPSARIQSILNDFGAEGYIFHEFDDGDQEELEYRFPELSYPDSRFDHNMQILGELESSDPSTQIWGLLGAFALLLLIVVIVIRFSTG